MSKAVLAACLAVASSPCTVTAQPLTLSEVISRAREQAPRVVSARLAVEEARARLVGAALRQVNPEFEGAAGSRRGVSGSTVDLDVGVTQRFEPGGRRSARVSGAEAAVVQSQATAEEVARAVVLDAVTAFLRAIRGTERERLLASAEAVANALHQAADRRYRAGDVAILDVNVARAALARVRADREGARADITAALGDLAVTLGTEANAQVDPTIPPPTPADAAALQRTAHERPELRALEAAIREADATVVLGRTFAKPEFGAGARYARDEGDNVLTGVVTLTLPLFSRGQGLVAEGSARASRLRAELDAMRRRIRTEVQTAIATFDRRLETVTILERDALPAVNENEALATRSYDAGQIGLAEVLLIRREILDTRFQHLDARLDAALARVELDAAAGVLR